MTRRRSTPGKQQIDRFGISMPVLGLIFLRHAYNRYQKVKIEAEKDLHSHPHRGKRPLTKKDFEAWNSMYLTDKACLVRFSNISIGNLR